MSTWQVFMMWFTLAGTAWIVVCAAHIFVPLAFGVLQTMSMGRVEKNGGTNGPTDRVTLWARAIAVVGIPGVIALIATYAWTIEIPKITKQLEVNHQEIMSLREKVLLLDQKAEEQLRMGRWICAGLQKTDDDRRRCFDE